MKTILAAILLLAAGEYPIDTVGDVVAPGVTAPFTGGTVANSTTFTQGITANGNSILQNANFTGPVNFRSAMPQMELGIPGSVQGQIKLAYGAVAGQGVKISGTGNAMYFNNYADNYVTGIFTRIQDYQGNGLDMSNLNTSTILRANAGAVACTFTAAGANFALPVQIQGAASIRSGSAAPEGSVSGSTGDIYLRTGGGAGTSFCVKESGTSTNTGWVCK